MCPKIIPAACLEQIRLNCFVKFVCSCKKFTFYLQYPHFFHIRISQISFKIITVDTKHQLLINNHFHILNALLQQCTECVTLPNGRVPPKLITYFLFHIKPVSPNTGFPLFHAKTKGRKPKTSFLPYYF